MKSYSVEGSYKTVYDSTVPYKFQIRCSIFLGNRGKPLESKFWCWEFRGWQTYNVITYPSNNGYQSIVISSVNLNTENLFIILSFLIKICIQFETIIVYHKSCTILNDRLSCYIKLRISLLPYNCGSFLKVCRSHTNG